VRLVSQAKSTVRRRREEAVRSDCSSLGCEGSGTATAAAVQQGTELLDCGAGRMLTKWWLVLLLIMGEVQSWSSSMPGAVQVRRTAGGQTVVVFTTGMPTPLTVSSAQPFRRRPKGVSVFHVKLPVKQAKTAIGVQFRDKPSTNYLTPSYDPSNSQYVSMGGAGFIYPKSTLSKGKYGEGDSVCIKLDWDAQKVTFAINDGPICGSTMIDPSVNFAYPSISSEGGEVVCEVRLSEE